LSARQSKAIENIQKRAIRIIYGEGDYKTALTVAGVDSLKNRRETLILMARFFNGQVLANNVLYFATYYPNDVTMKLSVA